MNRNNEIIISQRVDLVASGSCFSDCVGLIEHERDSLLPIIVLLACGLCGACNVGLAAYPEKPVRVIVPNPPGSNADLLMRLLASKLSNSLGQNMVIDNRGGGNGVIANNVVANALPDGYTILLGNASNLAGDLSSVLASDPLKGFAAIGLIAKLPYVLAVDYSRAIKSVKELVDYTKARPNKLSYAYTPGGSLYAGALFARATGFKINGIPFNGAPQAITEIIGGDITYTFLAYQALSSSLKASRIRAIAITAANRPTWLADVPTMIECGYPGFELNSFVGLYAPVKTPRNIIEVFSSALIQAIKDPALGVKYAEAGTTLSPLSPEETDKFTAGEIKRLRELDKMSNAGR